MNALQKNQTIAEQIRENLNRPSNRIDWHSKWLAHAKLASLRSSDARTKCGCVLVRDNQLISEGYNGALRGIDDTAVPNYEGNERPVFSKYYFHSHSETNSIYNAARIGVSTKDCLAYITNLPCANCYQALYQAGIIKIYVPDKDFNYAKCVDNDQQRELLEYLKFLTKNRLPIEHVSCNITIEIKS